ncbi:ABC transporter ATP-binding protein [Paraflavitalea speifideaquila]|uniref:ABC transporter ATP-binding protein n=1 Tax=Paraflavitalea speifideaquila TaxID=3076558 RepID=UPI0028E89AB2|nr:ABC transporter ATP-binding protein [Paraflavitalea speifideiaquila]
MKQRLGIAVALVHNPQLIILDEPTNGLDPQGIADIRHFILHLSKEQGKTILVSSHLLYEIEMTANRMIIIDKGKKVTEGSVKELFDPSKLLIKISVRNIEQVAPQLQNSPWRKYIQTQEQNNILFQMDEQQVPALTAYLVNLGAAITSIQPQHSLEAYFLALTTTNRHVDTFTNGAL